jgi:hypothetical protein
MSSDHIDVMYSRSAAEIVAYCKTLAQELGLTLEDSPYWAHSDLPAMEQPPDALTLSVTKPFEALVPFRFTREEVLEYAKGTTKAAIESRIRTDLEIRLRDDVAASREQSCIHGQS